MDEGPALRGGIDVAIPTPGAAVWDDDYTNPTPSFPLTPQQEQEQEQARRQRRQPPPQPEPEPQPQPDAAATVLQAACRTHLVRQLRAWFTWSTRQSPGGGQGRRRRRPASDAHLRAALGELRGRLHALSAGDSGAEIGELERRIGALEAAQGAGQPAASAERGAPKRRARRRRRRTPAHSEQSSLRVKSRPSVRTQASLRRGSKRDTAAGSSLSAFSAEFNSGTVDGWADWLPRHRWFQGLAGQLHALHSLADPVSGDETRSHIRAHVERELSGHGNESGAARRRDWHHVSGSIGSARSFGPPPALPPRVAPPAVPAREDWVTRLSRRSRSAGARPCSAPAQSQSSGSLLGWGASADRLCVGLRRDVGGSTGFGVVLQCKPAAAMERRLQPPSQTLVTAVAPGSDAAAAGVVVGMAVLSVNGEELPPDTSATKLAQIFETIVDRDEVQFEFETTGGGTSKPPNTHSDDAWSDHKGPAPAEGWCSRLQNAVSTANLGPNDAMICVAWDGGGTDHTAASAMCESAAWQLHDAISACFGDIAEVACVDIGQQNDACDEGSRSEMWTRQADELIVRMVPEYTSATGGRIAWSTVAAKMTGWGQSMPAPIHFSGRQCRERWESVLDPRRSTWSALRRPQIAVWHHDGATATSERVYTSQSQGKVQWPTEEEVIGLVGAHLHEHVASQADEEATAAGHKQVRDAMERRRSLHEEIMRSQVANAQLGRKLASVAAAALASGPRAAAEITATVRNNALRATAAPARDCTPGGAAGAWRPRPTYLLVPAAASAINTHSRAWLRSVRRAHARGVARSPAGAGDRRGANADACAGAAAVAGCFRQCLPGAFVSVCCVVFVMHSASLSPRFSPSPAC